VLGAREPVAAMAVLPADTCLRSSDMKSQTSLVIAGAAIALALAGQTGCAVAQTTEPKFRITLSAAAKKSAPATRARTSGQIACTIYGCHPIPPGCHPEMGYNWDGIPTGFDIVVCGPRRLRYR
jgi:hypothetical protein